jgi:BirA family biotin operon repressor/biotin-[acetyl-CoA-carboxylase] ligase
MTAYLIKAVYATFAEYEACGFTPFAQRWMAHDWLRGQKVTVDAQQVHVTGIAAGIDEDGALLIDSEDGERQRVTSGSIIAATKFNDRT